MRPPRNPTSPPRTIVVRPPAPAVWTPDEMARAEARAAGLPATPIATLVYDPRRDGLPLFPTIPDSPRHVTPAPRPTGKPATLAMPYGRPGLAPAPVPVTAALAELASIVSGKPAPAEADTPAPPEAARLSPEARARLDAARRPRPIVVNAPEAARKAYEPAGYPVPPIMQPVQPTTPSPDDVRKARLRRAVRYAVMGAAVSAALGALCFITAVSFISLYAKP